MDDALPEKELPTSLPWSRRWLEVGLIFALIVVWAGVQPPNVNEAHYLTKAKHYWNPDFGPGDHFLSSSDAHLTFYWSLGWLTQWLSLSATAWVGRIVCWGMLAASWQRLSYLLLPRAWLSLLTAGVTFAGIDYGHMAGEWLIGGVEAKGFAYPFLFWGLAAALSGRWNWAWILLGIASGLHVLVGGWGVVALGIAWVLQGPTRPALVPMLPGLVLGGMISLAGLVPAIMMNQGQPPDVTLRASYIYVFERLPHHLVVHRFDFGFKVRFAVLVIAWLGSVALWWFRMPEERTGRFRLFHGFVAGCLSIAVCGIVIDQWFCYWTQDDELAARLLRFYWFRMADVMVPVGLAMNLSLLVMHRPPLRKRSIRDVPLAFAILLILIGIVDRVESGWLAEHPPARRDNYSSYEDWRATCAWIRENTPNDARFLTPQRLTTFKWYAQRSEVFTIKDIPQDSAAILEWRKRRSQFRFSWRSHAVFSEENIRVLAERYGFDYVVLDRRRADAWKLEPDWTFRRVYPEDPQHTSDFEVYAIDSTPSSQ
ncbi:MAG: DUF6798 domain-containing protein [Pirellulaceae bacterium]